MTVVAETIARYYGFWPIDKQRKHEHGPDESLRNIVHGRKDDLRKPQIPSTCFLKGACLSHPWISYDIV